MRITKTALVALAIAALLSTGASAGTDLNEDVALRVFLMIIAAPSVTNVVGLGGVETFVTITNAGPDDVVLHVSYINGQAYRQHVNVELGTMGGFDPSPDYCRECDFPIPLTGNDTETLVITSGPGGTRIQAEDLALDLSCPWPYGMLVVALEDEDGNTITDNVLLGEEVVVNYQAGTAFSFPAIPFQGGAGNNDRHYGFDDVEYGKLPRIVAADYLAPHINRSGNAVLALFTLGFERQFPPLVDCSVTGWDAHENSVSASFQFGCWGLWDLYDISPEFYYPNLGLFGNNPHHDDEDHGDPPTDDTHGWLQLNCRVDTNPAAADGWEADGGVHGAIFQGQRGGSVLAAGSGATFGSAAQWGRLLYQSVTTGDAVTLIIEETHSGMD